MIQRISVSEAQYVAHAMVRELMDYGEPPSDFNTRYPGRLESCLDQPFTHFNGRYVYWTVWHRAAMLFYLIIKNHPFENGNKRMAVCVTLAFLYKNEKWINMSPQALYELAKIIAESDPKIMDFAVERVKKLFKDHATTL